MKIGILSDTHSTWDDRYIKHFSSCDEIWHAGDIGDITLLQRLQQIGPKVRAVSGNIDSGLVRRQCKEVEQFTVEGVNVYLTHIGGYPGKYAPGIQQSLIYGKTKLFVCGHSHILKVMPDQRLNLLHINPGAAGVHGWQKVRTLVRLTIEQGNFSDLEVIELSPHQQV